MNPDWNTHMKKWMQGFLRGSERHARAVKFLLNHTDQLAGMLTADDADAGESLRRLRAEWTTEEGGR